jgi:hypothetical protein
VKARTQLYHSAHTLDQITIVNIASGSETVIFSAFFRENTGRLVRHTKIQPHMNKAMNSRLCNFLTLFVAILFAVSCSSTMQHGDTVQMDKGGDLLVSKKEFSERIHENSIKEMDTDLDGQISLDGWVAAHPNARAADEHFNRIDKNEDGKIASEETVLYLYEHVSYGPLFDSVDYSRDGMLQSKELRSAEPRYFQLNLLSLEFG